MKVTKCQELDIQCMLGTQDAGIICWPSGSQLGQCRRTVLGALCS